MDQSPLARLSAELRNTIYEMALLMPPDDSRITRIPYINLTIAASHYKTDQWTVSYGGEPVNALIQTCRQIRTEASGIFYFNNNFAIAADYSHDDTEVWMPRLTKKLIDLGSEVLRGMRVLRIHQYVKREIIFTTAMDNPNKKLVEYSGYRFYEHGGFGAEIYDPVVAAFEHLGIELEQKAVRCGYSDVDALEELRSLSTAELAETSHLWICMGRDRLYIFAAKTAALEGRSLVEVTEESAGWRLKAALRVLHGKGLKVCRLEQADHDGDATRWYTSTANATGRG